MDTIEGDGVFKIRNGNDGEKLVLVRKDIKGTYRRFTEDDGKRIVFVRV